MTRTRTVATVEFLGRDTAPSAGVGAFPNHLTQLSHPLDRYNKFQDSGGLFS